MSVDHAKFFVKRQNTTLDAFLGGRLALCQPEKGFRAGSDSVLLGASVPRDATRVLDLGAGVGAAGLVAAVWAEEAEIFLAERNEEALALARDNAGRNGFSERVHVLSVDVTSSGPGREAAGIAANSFDVVIANPPYFIERRGTPSGDAGRHAARYAEDGEIALWVRAAASAAAAGGEAIFVLPTGRLGEVLAVLEGRFGGIRLLPIAARPGAAAKRMLIRGGKGSRAALRLLAPLVLHGPSGNGFTAESADILLGRTKLDW